MERVWEMGNKKWKKNSVFGMEKEKGNERCGNERKRREGLGNNVK